MIKKAYISNTHIYKALERHISELNDDDSFKSHFNKKKDIKFVSVKHIKDFGAYFIINPATNQILKELPIVLNHLIISSTWKELLEKLQYTIPSRKKVQNFIKSEKHEFICKSIASFYGEDRFDFEISNDKVYYHILFPEIIVVNSHNPQCRITLRNIYVQLQYFVNSDRFGGLRLSKEYYTHKEQRHRYVHSHVPRYDENSQDYNIDTFKNFCTGSGTFLENFSGSSLNTKEDHFKFELFLFTLEDLITSESQEGVPHISIGGVIESGIVSNSVEPLLVDLFNRISGDISIRAIANSINNPASLSRHTRTINHNKRRFETVYGFFKRYIKLQKSDHLELDYTYMYEKIEEVLQALEEFDEIDISLETGILGHDVSAVLYFIDINVIRYQYIDRPDHYVNWRDYGHLKTGSYSIDHKNYLQAKAEFIKKQNSESEEIENYDFVVLDRISNNQILKFKNKLIYATRIKEKSQQETELFDQKEPRGENYKESYRICFKDQVEQFYESYIEYKAILKKAEDRASYYIEDKSYSYTK